MMADPLETALTWFEHWLEHAIETKTIWLWLAGLGIVALALLIKGV